MKEQRIPAVLVLADGATFPGYAFGAERTVFGEAVFTTAMTGYQETMTDPSYHRQIVVTTAPQIGNTGWNDEDNESHDNRIWVAGLVVRDLSRRVSNWRAARSLEEEMRAQDITGIRGVDTRSLVRHLRNYGSIAAGIFTGEEARQDVDTLVAKVQGQPSMEGADLAAGDFVRWARQVIDVLDQLANVPGDARRSRACRRAADLVSRGVVATSLPAASAPRADED